MRLMLVFPLLFVIVCTIVEFFLFTNTTYAIIATTVSFCFYWVFAGGFLALITRIYTRRFSFAKFIFAWPVALFSEKSAVWLFENTNSSIKKVTRIFKRKKIELTLKYKWHSNPPSSPGYYWAIIKGENTMEWVHVITCPDSILRPTIDGDEYSFDCFEVWSNRVMVPDVETARKKCCHL